MRVVTGVRCDCVGYDDAAAMTGVAVYIVGCIRMCACVVVVVVVVV